MSTPDYSNLKVNLSSMNQFFNENGVKLSDAEKAQIKSIFDSSNTQTESDKNVEEQLTGNERVSFLKAVKNALPNIYNKIVDFMMAAEHSEYMEKAREDAMKEVEKFHQEQERDRIQNDIENSGLV